MQLPVLISPDQVVPAPKGSVKGALNADLERHTSMSHRGDRAVGVDEVVRNWLVAEHGFALSAAATISFGWNYAAVANPMRPAVRCRKTSL